MRVNHLNPKDFTRAPMTRCGIAGNTQARTLKNLRNARLCIERCSIQKLRGPVFDSERFSLPALPCVRLSDLNALSGVCGLRGGMFCSERRPKPPPSSAERSDTPLTKRRLSIAGNAQARILRNPRKGCLRTHKFGTQNRPRSNERTPPRSAHFSKKPKSCFSLVLTLF